MQEIKIRTRERKDWDKLAFPEHGDLPEAQLIGVGVVQAGMESGDPAVGFIFEHDGKKCVAQVSLNMLDMIAGAANGHDQRWKEEKAAENN